MIDPEPFQRPHPQHHNLFILIQLKMCISKVPYNGKSKNQGVIQVSYLESLEASLILNPISNYS